MEENEELVFYYLYFFEYLARKTFPMTSNLGTVL